MPRGFMSIGGIAFLVGIVGAILLGVLDGLEIEMFADAMWIAWVLIIAGIVIGALNITKKESVAFMVAILILATGTITLSFLPTITGMLQSVLERLSQVLVPAAVVVALVTVIQKARN